MEKTEQEKELPLTSFGRTADSPPEWTGTGDDPAAAKASSYHIGTKDYYSLVWVPAGDLWSVPDKMLGSLGNTSEEELEVTQT